MNYRVLGRTGLKVSELCLGTMTFGENFFNIAVVDQAGANTMVARALDAGINFFDTADVYSYGRSEEVLGAALKDLPVGRDKIVIATKVRGAMSEAATAGTGDLNNVGLSRQHIFSSVEASLRRLGTDYIDLYQVHGWDVLTPLEETLRALDDLVRQGKVRYAGCSNWSARHLMKALVLAAAHDWAGFVSLQAYYSLVGRDLERELLPLCREEGVGVLPWSPLSGGFLSGKYRRDNPTPEGARRTAFDFPPIDEARGFDAVEALATIAKQRDIAVAQVALAWVLAQAQLGLVFYLSARVDKVQPLTAAGLFILYSALTGVTSSVILLLYTQASIAQTFIVTAGMFGATAVLGTVTKRSLAGAGHFFFMGLIGLILASIVGIFWHSAALQFVISVVGVLVFTGLTAWDAQRLKQMAVALPDGRVGAYAVVGALSLYLDFINLFFFLLRFTGSRRD